MVKFSIVCPIRNEVNLIPITLPSFYAVNPSEVVLCLDKPAPKQVLKVISKVASTLGMENLTRVIEIERNPEYRFHQAWVRRKGFWEAENERILTADIDLIINSKVLKAVRIVGFNNVGLVSLSKLHYPRGLTDYWREGVLLFSRNIVHGVLDRFMMTTTFTGLYALYRPYWLDSESEESVKRLVNPKQFFRGEVPKIAGASAFIGEDTFLRDSMIKKYKCIYLKDIGAVDLGVAHENNPEIQFRIGQYFARQKRSLIASLGRAFLRAQPYYLMGFLSERRKMSKTPREGCL
jgi:hypothetical protein